MYLFVYSMTRPPLFSSYAHPRFYICPTCASVYATRIPFVPFFPRLPSLFLHLPYTRLYVQALDAAKMNRAICLSRPTPAMTSLVATGERILGLHHHAPSERGTMGRLLQPLAEAFHELQQAGESDDGDDKRSFFGMRDFYSLLKLLRRLSQQGQHKGISSEKLSLAVCRNFGGSSKLLARANRLFHLKCLGFPPASLPQHVLQLIAHNLGDHDARHLLLFTSNAHALEAMFGANLLDMADCEVLMGSQFSEDTSELRLIHQVSHNEQVCSWRRKYQSGVDRQWQR